MFLGWRLDVLLRRLTVMTITLANLHSVNRVSITTLDQVQGGMSAVKEDVQKNCVQEDKSGIRMLNVVLGRMDRE